MDEEIVFSISFSKDDIQERAETNIGRELTDVELNRIKQCYWENETVPCARVEVLDSVIEMATNTKGYDWKSTDESYQTK